jgi:hypothetical protein
VGEGVGVGAGIVFISHRHLMSKQPRIDDEDYSTSDDIEIFFHRCHNVLMSWILRMLEVKDDSFISFVLKLILNLCIRCRFFYVY